MYRYIALIIGATLTLGACTQSNTPASSSKPVASSEHEASNATPPSPVAPKQVANYDGPFGLKMGLTRAQAGEVISGLTIDTDHPMWSDAPTVPVPHPYFESYILQFSKKSGLCAIHGIGKDIVSGSSGIQIRTQFDSLNEALTEKYGTGKKYDYSSDSDNSTDFWMMHLLQKDQVLAEVWSNKTKATLSNNISSILIQAHANNMSTGYINIEYEFDNIGDCVAEEKAKTNKAL